MTEHTSIYTVVGFEQGLRRLLPFCMNTNRLAAALAFHWRTSLTACSRSVWCGSVWFGRTDLCRIGDGLSCCGRAWMERNKHSWQKSAKRGWFWTSFLISLLTTAGVWWPQKKVLNGESKEKQDGTKESQTMRVRATAVSNCGDTSLYVESSTNSPTSEDPFRTAHSLVTQRKLWTGSMCSLVVN